MSENSNGTSESEMLRAKAEEKLKELENSTEVEKSNYIRLLHELQVHQVELEMQNVELRTSRSKEESATRKYIELYENAPAGYFTLSRDHRIRGMNLCGAQMLKKERAYLINSSFEFYVDKKCRLRFNEFIRAVFKEKVRQNCSVTMRPADGILIEVQLSGIITEIMDECSIVAVDITELRRSEEKIKVLSRSVEQSPVSVIITTPSGEIEYVNPKFLEVSGYAYEEVIGKKPAIFSPTQETGEINSELWGTIRSGKIWRGEFCNKRKNGEAYWEAASISPLIDDEGAIIHYVAVNEDISERKKMEQELILARDKAEEMNRMKSSFFANMSHELRTPMIGILGFSEVLQNEQLSDEAKESAKIINDSGHRLLETLNQVLDMSRIEAGKIRISYTDFDAVCAIDEVCRLFEQFAAKKGIFLKFDSAYSELVLNLDKTLFSHVITNLVNNAVKYTLNGGVNVYLSTGKDDSGDYAEIKIADTGIGIMQNDIPYIWNEFRQVSEGYARSFQGTGLGLSITKRYVEKMEGRIFVESHIGVGSTFIVQFPYNSLGGTKKNDNEIPFLTVFELNLANGRIPEALYIEDDPIAISLVKLLLSGVCKLDVVRNCNEALQCVKGKKYAVILIDINLGRDQIDGARTAQMIRQIEGYQETPIVALTAFAMKGDKEEFLRSGCSHYLSKPFTRRELLNLMSEVLLKA